MQKKSTTPRKQDASKKPTSRKGSAAGTQAADETAARAFLAITSGHGVGENLPDFITDAMLIALNMAATAHRLPEPSFESEETEAEAVALLVPIFERSGFFNLSGVALHRARLARDIASILANPETPTRLYNAIGDEVTSWSTDYCNEHAETPTYIEQCLISHLKREEKRKGGAK